MVTFATGHVRYLGSLLSPADASRQLDGGQGLLEASQGVVHLSDHCGVAVHVTQGLPKQHEPADPETLMSSAPPVTCVPWTGSSWSRMWAFGLSWMLPGWRLSSPRRSLMVSSSPQQSSTADTDTVRSVQVFSRRRSMALYSQEMAQGTRPSFWRLSPLPTMLDQEPEAEHRAEPHVGSTETLRPPTASRGLCGPTAHGSDTETGNMCSANGSQRRCEPMAPHSGRSLTHIGTSQTQNTAVAAAEHTADDVGQDAGAHLGLAGNKGRRALRRPMRRQHH
ncbi:hypothetical protein EYF80_051324 [Liparis tanakae]|uniref:Uncharacterized protein n=1 Tax=Liparis tanakae TaxID=230148 RepID=A0A4Z2FBH9_9TELE|nr:hypothetical protein EYF80_051324 [Liparis tanakae]